MSNINIKKGDHAMLVRLRSHASIVGESGEYPRIDVVKVTKVKGGEAQEAKDAVTGAVVFSIYNRDRAIWLRICGATFALPPQFSISTPAELVAALDGASEEMEGLEWRATDVRNFLVNYLRRNLVKTNPRGDYTLVLVRGTTPLAAYETETSSWDWLTAAGIFRDSGIKVQTTDKIRFVKGRWTRRGAPAGGEWSFIPAKGQGVDAVRVPYAIYTPDKHKSRQAAWGIKGRTSGNPGVGRPRWKYWDARGVEHYGYVEKTIDKGGTDVTYFMIDENTGELSLTNGLLSKKMRRVI